MNVLLDLNVGVTRENHPCYSAMPKVALANEGPNVINRIRGHRPTRDDDDRKALPLIPFETKGMRFESINPISPDGRPVPILILEDSPYGRACQRVYTKSRHFAVFFPRSYLSSDACTYSDLATEDGKAEGMGGVTRRLLQDFFYLFSEEGIKLMWSGGLKGEDVTTVLPSAEREALAAEKAASAIQDGRVGREQQKEKKKADDRAILFPCDFPMSAIDGFPVEELKGESDKTSFMVLGDDGNQYRFPRVTIDMVFVPADPDAESQGAPRDAYYPDEHFTGVKSAGELFVFTLADPRLNVAKGLLRLMTKNADCREILMRKEKTNIESRKVAASTTMVADDANTYRLDSRYINEADHLLTEKDVFFMLSVATTKGYAFMTEVESDAESALWMENRSVYNPARLLDIRPKTQEGKDWNRRIDACYMGFPKDTTIMTRPELVWRDQFVLCSAGSQRAHSARNANERVLVYAKPSRVVRLSQRHIDPLLFMSSVLVFSPLGVRDSVFEVQYSVPGIRPTNSCPYPQMSEKSHVTIKESNDHVRESLRARKPLTAVDDEYSCDRIRRENFVVEPLNTNWNLHIGRNPVLTTQSCRKEAFSEVVKALTNLDNLPRPIRAVVNYIHDETKQDRGFSLIPDLYSDEYKFDDYKDLTPCGTFDVNYNQKYLEGPNLCIVQAHKLIRLTDAMIMSCCRLQYGHQFYLFICGPSGTGKSNLMTIMRAHSLEGTARKSDSETAMAKSTTSKFCGEIEIKDDVDKTSSILSQKEDGSLKVRSTEGISVRDSFILSAVSSKRKTDVVVSDHRHSLLALSNEWGRDVMNPFVLDRFTVCEMLKTTREESAEVMQANANLSYSSSERDSNLSEFRTIRFKRQCFLTLLDYFIRSGAISYDSDNAITDATSAYHMRVCSIVEDMNGFAPVALSSSRFKKDRLGKVIEVCMKERIWVSLSSGCFPMIPPNTPFTYEMFKIIADAGLLVANEEDYIRALSYFEEDIEFAEFRAIMQMIVKNHDPTMDYLPENVTDSCLRNENFFFEVNKSPEMSDDVSYSRLHAFPVVYIPPNLPADAELGILATAVKDKNPNLSYHKILEELKNLRDKTFSTGEKGGLVSNKDTTGLRMGELNEEKARALAEHTAAVKNNNDAVQQYSDKNCNERKKALTRLKDAIAAKKLADDNVAYGACIRTSAMFCSEASSSGPILERHSCPIEHDKKRDRDGNELPASKEVTMGTKYSISREFYDRVVSNSRYRSKASQSTEHEGFAETTLETVLKLFPYEGMHKRKIVLPGMVFDKIFVGQKSKAQKELPQVMKTLVSKPPNNSDSDELDWYMPTQYSIGTTGLKYTAPSKEPMPRLVGKELFLSVTGGTKNVYRKDAPNQHRHCDYSEAVYDKNLYRILMEGHKRRGVASEEEKAKMEGLVERQMAHLITIQKRSLHFSPIALERTFNAKRAKRTSSKPPPEYPACVIDADRIRANAMKGNAVKGIGVTKAYQLLPEDTFESLFPGCDNAFMNPDLWTDTPDAPTPELVEEGFDSDRPPSPQESENDFDSMEEPQPVPAPTLKRQREDDELSADSGRHVYHNMDLPREHPLYESPPAFESDDEYENRQQSQSGIIHNDVPRQTPEYMNDPRSALEALLGAADIEDSRF